MTGSPRPTEWRFHVELPEETAHGFLARIRALRCLMEKDLFTGVAPDMAARKKKFALPVEGRAPRDIPDRSLPAIIETIRQDPGCWRGWVDTDGVSWIYSVEPGDLSWAPERFTNNSLDFTMLVQWLVAKK